jgi:lactoylglutathione lyase
VAVWSRNLESLTTFYVNYFGAIAGEVYQNPKKHFMSRFLTFDSGARLEIMQKELLRERDSAIASETIGYAHFSIAVGSKETVDALTARLTAHEVPLISAPRWTGDGYYESVILDPDGNPVEITI